MDYRIDEELEEMQAQLGEEEIPEEELEFDEKYAQLSDNAWKLILQYWYSLPVDERPRDWLFPQKADPSKPIDHQRVPDFIRAHEKELGWAHRFTCHTFRHYVECF